MPEFECKIIGENGAVEKRIFTADSRPALLDELAGSDAMVVSVKKVQEKFDLNRWLAKIQKPKKNEIEHFTTQLSSLLNAGVPMLGSLDALSAQTETDAMRRIIRTIYDDLNGGKQLSEALGRFPKVFSPMYINMVAAGEKAGVMDTVLQRLAMFIGKELAMNADIKSAVRYPIIIFGVLIFAFSMAIIFVIPRFSNLYQKQGIDLPLPTQILIGINQAVTEYWFITLIVSVIISMASVMFFRTNRGITVKDWFKLNFPVFKSIFRKNAISRFAHMLETLIRSGIHIISGLKTVEKTVGNSLVEQGIAKAREDAAGGSQLAPALAQCKYFPPMAIKMISVGEDSGTLDVMLEKVGQHYDNEVSHLLKRLTALLEPMMTVIMGAFLLLIALGIFLPMWQVYEVF